MVTQIDEKFLDKIVRDIASKKGIFSAVLRVENGDGSFSWTGAAGNMQKGSQYFVASVTKLYITAIVARLMVEGRLQLEDLIATYLPAEFIQGLHVLKGKEYSEKITVRHLISNTSGLPDYFFHKQPNGKTFASQILEGNDVSCRLEDTIRYVKKLTPKFVPGRKGKAAYSDTNYQLLGGIIETITGKHISEVLQEYIFNH